MDDGLVTLRIYGTDARGGRVPIAGFAGLLRRFAATVAIFERAFTAQRTRSTDLNVAALNRENPMVVGLRAEARVRGYLPTPAITWAFGEIERIRRGEPLDHRVPFDALDNVMTLSDDGDELREGVAAFVADFGAYRISFDRKLAAAAKAQRDLALASLPAPIWFAGTSRGVLMGELRGAMDLDGEREFFIRTVSGNRRIKCIFPEHIRPKMNKLLFGPPVKIEGFLHYDGTGPHAFLVEAIDVVEIHEEGRPHLFDKAGLFADSYYTPSAELPS